jgi:hypothetical protein
LLATVLVDVFGQQTVTIAAGQQFFEQLASEQEKA